jgi:hypothetical protein
MTGTIRQTAGRRQASRRTRPSIIALCKERQRHDVGGLKKVEPRPKAWHDPASTNAGRLKTNMLTRAALLAAAIVLIGPDAHARTPKQQAQGANIGSGIAVLVDGGGGVFSGATAGVLVSAISRRGQP